MCWGPSPNSFFSFFSTIHPGRLLTTASQHSSPRHNRTYNLPHRLRSSKQNSYYLLNPPCASNLIAKELALTATKNRPTQPHDGALPKPKPKNLGLVLPEEDEFGVETVLCEPTTPKNDLEYQQLARHAKQETVPLENRLTP
jgi:hypothetical protein